MKKLIALLLAAVMTLALVACGDKSDDQGSNDGQSGGKKTVVKISMTEGLNSSTYKRAVEFGEKVNAAAATRSISRSIPATSSAATTM